MNETAFRSALAESRNGANHFVRYPLNRAFQFSDGVEDLAGAGCYWMLDIIATEALKPLRAALQGEGGQGILKVTVADHCADFALTIEDDQPPVWSRHIEWTDMPTGEYLFIVADELERFAMILMSEY